MESDTKKRLRRTERARQMRDAQRRRRERLRTEKRRFLQIILPEELRLRLHGMADARGETLQVTALRLIEASLGAGGSVAFTAGVTTTEIVTTPIQPAPALTFSGELEKPASTSSSMLQLDLF